MEGLAVLLLDVEYICREKIECGEGRGEFLAVGCGKVGGMRAVRSRRRL